MAASGTRHLTAAAATPTVVAVGFGALAALTGNSWFVLLAGGCAGLVVASLTAGVWAPRLDDLTVGVTGPARLAVGETGTYRLHVHNRGQASSAPVTVSHQMRGLSAVRVHVGRLPPGGRAGVDHVRTATIRGVADSTTIRMESSAPLGLLASERTSDHAHRLIVHPAPLPPDPSFALPGPGVESADPVPGVGLDLAGIREWRTGDDPRRIHWRSTARRGRLIVAERGTGPAPAMSVVVVGPSEAPDWEPLVATAAATARVAQLAGRPVAVTAWGPTGPSTIAAGTPLDLLDWWAALGDVLLPTPQDLVAARGGHPSAAALVVVASAHATSAWWDLLRHSAAGAGLPVLRLTIPTAAAVAWPVGAVGP